MAPWHRSCGFPSCSPTNLFCHARLPCREFPAIRRPCCKLPRSQRCRRKACQALHTRLVFELIPRLFLQFPQCSFFPPLFRLTIIVGCLCQTPRRFTETLYSRNFSSRSRRLFQPSL